MKCIVALLALVTVLAQPSFAAEYPERPVRIIVGFAAGGPTDVAARIIAKGLSDEFGQQFVVENMPGANANIAADAVGTAPADGYTLLYATSSIVISQFLYRDLRHKLADFVPINLSVTIPHVLVVPTSSRYRSVEELIAALKSGKQLSYGSAGVGNANHLSPLIFLNAIGASALHVPYRGSAPALTDLIAGRIDFMIDAVSTAFPYIEGRALRALGVASRDPLPVLPEVPALARSVVPGFEVGAWSGILAPRTTPPEVLRRLDQAAHKALAKPEVRSAFEKQGVDIVDGNAERFSEFIAAESNRIGGIIKAGAIQADQ
jgi:tripartite-type tricarboxylate transporter receptor subunit TctC